MNIEFDGKIVIEVPTDDELSEIYDSVKETMQREDVIEFMGEICERTKKMAEAEGLGAEAAFNGWDMIDKITWYVSEAYCIGFIRGIKTAFEGIAGQVENQAKEGGNN